MGLPPEPQRAAPSPRAVALGSAGLALIAGSAPYSGEAFGLVVPVEPKVEIVDHVLPAAVVLVAALVNLYAGKTTLGGVLTIALAGLWITATHAPLLIDAGAGNVGWAAALWHSLPGIAIFIGALLTTVALWRAEDASARPPAPETENDTAPD